MKTKQEVIREAWGDLFEKYKDRIDSEGFLHYKSHSKYLEAREALGGIHFHPSRYAFRPDSLIRIENNNGWTRIESKDDLPTEKGKYKVVIRGRDFSSHWWIFDMYHPEYDHDRWVRCYSHYKGVEEEKPPIY